MRPDPVAPPRPAVPADRTARSDGAGSPHGNPPPPFAPVPSPPAGGPLGSGSARGQGWAVARLVAVLGAIVAVFLVAGLGDLLIFIAALVLMVAAHEFAHFVTAKWSHMKVTEFFIGFGPRLWSVRRGETDYGFKPILAGAYVKIPGMTNLEEVDPADEARTYRRQPFHRRIIVASAGSISHFIMALVLAWVAIMAFGTPSATQVEVTGFTQWAGHKQTAAQLAGLKTGDRILSVDGKPISTALMLSSDIQKADGRPVTMVVTRSGHRRNVTVQPQAGHKTKNEGEALGPAANGKTDWLIGVSTTLAAKFTPEGPLRAVGTAGARIGAITTATVKGIGHVFSPGGLGNLYDQVTNPQVAKQASAHPATSNRVVSLFGVARLATQAEQAGGYDFISILIALNIVLGLMNMLPMLPLDGGHVVIALYERVRTRRGRPYYQADARKLLPVAYAFMVVLILIVGAAVFLDIAHPIANPFG